MSETRTNFNAILAEIIPTLVEYASKYQYDLLTAFNECQDNSDIENEKIHHPSLKKLIVKYYDRLTDARQT